MELSFAAGLILFIIISFILYVAGAYYANNRDKRRNRQRDAKHENQR